ncbi:hypothetical protein NQ318_018687, partial [Aromia moschata]
MLSVQMEQWINLKFLCTGINFYPADKFLNGLTGLQRDVKRPKTIRALDGPQPVKAKATEVLNQLTKADFQHCFQQWKSRMERCRDRQGEYIEGEKVVT